VIAAQGAAVVKDKEHGVAHMLCICAYPAAQMQLMVCTTQRQDVSAC
jgi:hypothetical protein